MTTLAERLEGEFDAQSRDLARELIREFMRPPPRQTVTEWAESERYLSSVESSEPGPYRVTRTPYAQEPQDCMSPRSAVEEVVLQWAAQTGKTSALLNCLGSAIANNPGPIMIVWPTNTVAKRNSRQRIAPLLTGSQQLRERVAQNRSRDKANTTLLKEFTGGVLVVAGANSAADLRSTPVRDLYLDEVDNFPHDVDGEGDPSKLAEARQTTFTRRKRLRTSTPTTKGYSRIEAALLASDNCRLHVPCPHCGAMQQLELGISEPWGLKWDKAPSGAPIAASVHYVCRESGCVIKEHQKPGMLAAGRWVPLNPGAQGGRVRGFQLSGLYSPLGWLAWRTIAQEWHDARKAEERGDASLMRVFVNTRLAETYEESGDRVASSELQRRAQDIPLGIVQWGHYVRTLGVDVQGDRLEVFDWAWGRGMCSQLVAVRIIYGDPALREDQAGSPWGELTKYRETPVEHASGHEAPLLACAIDSGGHHTQQVYAYARDHRHEHVIAVKGSSQRGKPILGKPTAVDLNRRGEKVKQGAKVWPVGPDTAKAVLFGRMRVDTPGPGYILLSSNLSPEVFDGLTSERLVGRYVKGRHKLEWVPVPGVRNEPLDGAVYALAAAHFRGVDRWKDGGEWSTWQQRLEPSGERKVKPPPKPEPASERRPVKGGKISFDGMRRFGRS